MRVVVTGSTGLIGSALVPALREAGHDVARLVRSTPRAPDEFVWNPAAGTIDPTALAGVEAVVNLAGAGIGDRRWTEARRRVIRDSRVLGTRTLVRALQAGDRPPQVFLQASAVGWYGDRGEETLTEESAPGQGFLADVVRAVEAETEPLRAAGSQLCEGTRVCLARTGLVMSPTGGAFAPLLRLIRLGLGGRVGNGRQWWPWITLDDEVRALLFLLEGSAAGPVNLTAPRPERNGPLIAALGRAVGRPTPLPVPYPALRLAVGQFARDILASQRVLPARLVNEGFEFRHPDIADAAAWITGKP
ncbi:MAG: uncharacterized protein QG608_615 [Actinomycetota bacterium]|nr:uncharacterized protein [Actinomycetota bacterium]